MEQYIEQTASCDYSGRKRVGYLLLFSASVIFLILTAVCAASSLSNRADGSLKINWIAVICVVVFILFAAFAWRKKDVFCVDYDYSYFDGQISVSAIYNSKRRKQLLDLDLGTVRMCGSTASHAYQNIVVQNNAIKHKWYANAESPLFFFSYDKNGRRELVLLELDERMIDALKHSKKLARGAWQDTEGKSNSYAGLS